MDSGHGDRHEKTRVPSTETSKEGECDLPSKLS